MSWLPAWSRREWLLALVLMVAIVLAYSPVRHAGYIWDDNDQITENPCIVGPLGLKEIWTTNAAQFYPLTLTTFWLEHALWGLAPAGFHLVNVLLHGACALVLWRLLMALRIPGAWLAAALWALHPVQVESVAWVAETKNTQSGLFFLLSILFFVQWQRAEQVALPRQRNWDYAWMLIFAALAMASKSSTVVLPVMLCLAAWWMEGRWRWRNLITTAPVFLMAIVPVALSVWTVRVQSITGEVHSVIAWPQRLAGAGSAVWFYLGKLIWPYPLVTVYPGWQVDSGQQFSYLPLLAVIVVWLVLWFKRDSWARPWFFAFSYFLVALLPVLGLVDQMILHFSLVFDHFQYLASMGPLALVGAGVVRGAELALPRKTWLTSAVGTALLLILTLLSWQRAWAYRDSETLWRDTLAKYPNSWIAHCDLGMALSKEGKMEEATDELQEAVKDNPKSAGAHYNFGFFLSQEGKTDEAIAQYHAALEVQPNYVKVFLNLGAALFSQGRLDEAIIYYQKALANNPDDMKAYNDLATALLHKGELDAAIAEYQKALTIDPDFAYTHYNLGVAYFQKGRLDETIQEFQEAVRLSPDDANFQNNLEKAQEMEDRSTFK
jgi:tetratricopeptide (TPR) repeat protein